MQCGGWSLKWQGCEGNYAWEDDAKTQSNASSILDALVNLNQSVNFILFSLALFTRSILIQKV